MKRQIPLRLALRDDGPRRSMRVAESFEITKSVTELVKADGEHLHLERDVGRCSCSESGQARGGPSSDVELALLEAIANRHRAVAAEHVEQRRSRRDR